MLLAVDTGVDKFHIFYVVLNEDDVVRLLSLLGTLLIGACDVVDMRQCGVMKHVLVDELREDELVIIEVRNGYELGLLRSLLLVPTVLAEVDESLRLAILILCNVEHVITDRTEIHFKMYACLLSYY